MGEGLFFFFFFVRLGLARPVFIHGPWSHRSGALGTRESSYWKYSAMPGLVRFFLFFIIWDATMEIKCWRKLFYL